MREIKFRAWDQNKMWYSDEQGWSAWGDCFMSLDTIMQYTGLKDRNGKEIYEGDVVIDADKDIGVVKYTTDCTPTIYGAGYFAEGKDGVGASLIYCEVIGNIHESPDLLEGE